MALHLLDPRVLAGRDAERLAAFGVAHHVARLVLLGPLPVRAGDLLARDQHARAVLVVVARWPAVCIAPVDHLVDLRA